MSALWTSDAIATATGGTAHGAFEVSGLSIDTRTLKPGDLFVPLKDVRDGHEFLDQAFKAGAAGALSEVETAHPHLRVSDTMAALRALGQAGRERCSAKRIAVTGSVGKTSVKDALGVMLRTFGPTHTSIKSFNNHFGVPITLATLPQETQFAVFETGMNHAGELTDLSKQVAPDIALITTVVGAHKANFDSVEAIADAKAEIRHGLIKGGLLILNQDNPYTPRVKAQAEGQNILTFGWSEKADVQITDSEHRADGGTVQIRINGQEVRVELSVVGAHWDYNAASCLAVAHALGLDLDKAAAAMKAVSASEGRGDLHTVSVGGKALTLIDESYNANPTSMEAAFTAAALKPGRKIAVLADMKELGADELELHAALAGPLTEAGFARVLTLGECMRALRGALPRAVRGAHADSIEEVETALRDEVQEGDVLLLKGSNSMGLGRLVKRLREEGSN